MSVKAKGVSHFYHDTTALDSVDLEIGQGEIVVICGRNGSGKSTLLKCLAGLQKPSAGRVTIDGLPVAKARGKIGLAVQYPEKALFGRTLYDDLAFSPKNAGLQPGEVSQCIDYAANAVGLTGSLLSQPHTSLSYGQKRLAGLACILSGKPSWLFLDEPTAGLDYPGKQRIAALLSNLHIAGVTIVLASHDPSFFAGICNRMVVLEAGRIVADGLPETIDLARAGIRSDTMELARRLNSCGFDVPETFSPEALADCLAEVIGRANTSHC